MNTNRRFGSLSSSEDPQKLADTAKGLIIGLSALIILAASWMGFEIGTEQVTNTAIVIGGAISAVWTLYGLVKKIVIAIQAKLSAN